MLGQRLQQKLSIKLSPQQILLMKLLQIPTVGIEQRIKQEIEENPALETETNEKDNTEDDIYDDNAEDNTDYDDDEFVNKEDEFDLEDYLNDDDTPYYKLNVNNYSPDDKIREVPFSSGLSFHDLLKEQLGIRILDKNRYEIGIYIIGNIDDSGYLQRSVDAIVDDLAFTQNLITNKETVTEVLEIIQEFDPSGVGARNLQDCLLIQLRRISNEQPSETVELAVKIIKRFFNEFTKKHYKKIMRRAEINEDQLKSAMDEILKLNPKPGNSLSETVKTNHYIIPDFTITNSNGGLELMINSWNTPELKINSTYSSMISELVKQKKSKKQRETLTFIKNKVDSAKWFIDAIKQRQNTLYSTMKAIMDYQEKYFISGSDSDLKPMILKDIADLVNLDISTISRVANSKYVQTPFGTFLLKSFFSERMQKDDGEEVSTREIKSILKEIIESEDKRKPFTDEYLTKLLKEKEYNIARRTVAKYREQLSIPVARLRKEL